MKKGEDFTGVCVVYFCHDGKGNVIMGKRSAHARDEEGRWDIGGGAVEFNDTVDRTLRKEIKEEYCVEVVDYKFLGYRDVHRMRDGKATHWIALDFKVEINPTTLAIGEPHKFDDLRMFPGSALPEPTHSQFPEFLKRYASSLSDIMGLP